MFRFRSTHISCFSIVLFILTPGGLISQQATIPKQEVRAVWITTVNGLDWPPAGTFNPHDQREALRKMIVTLHASNFNTIFFQVRGRGDAMYRSSFEPWSEILTGTLGGDPGWDPLQFVIDEAHARAMEVHAWFNTFYVKSGRTKEPESKPRHVSLEHPEYVRALESQVWIDPGIPAARQYVINVAMDIVRRYDVDGIQFDFMRYPGALYPDDATYKRYGGRLSKENWRRENVNMFARSFYDSAMTLKPMLKVGSAPIGIYENFGNEKGLQGYTELYQDSRAWLKESIQDYIVPQVYWSLGNQHADPDFAEVAKDWTSHAFGRQVCIGIGAYKPEVSKQMPELVDVARSLHAAGESFFRYGSLQDVMTLGGRYRYPAIIPPMPWKDSTPPNPPDHLAVEVVQTGIYRLRWNPPVLVADRDPASRYAVYRSSHTPIDVNNPANLLAIIPASDDQFTDTVGTIASQRSVYTVTALDKGNNESSPVPEQSVLPPQVAQLARQFNLHTGIGTAYRLEKSPVMFIPYEVERTATVSLRILDESEKEVSQVVEAVRQPGRYIAAADISILQNGKYSYQIVAGEVHQKRMFSIGR